MAYFQLKTLAVGAMLGLGLGLAGADRAAATVISYTDFVTNDNTALPFEVRIDDSTTGAGYYRVTVALSDPVFASANIQGFGFDGPAGFQNAYLGDGIDAANLLTTYDCPNPCGAGDLNFNGLSKDGVALNSIFDFVVDFDQTGAGTNNPLTFSLAYDPANLIPPFEDGEVPLLFPTIGLRTTSFSSDSFGTSSKDYSMTANCVQIVGSAEVSCFNDPSIGVTVPLPAAGWLLIGGLAGIGFVARRRA